MAITSIRIHPAIGVARLGNSPEHFFGPEEPSQWDPPPDGTYKDTLCRVKKQAARFRLFAFDGATFVKELLAGDPDVEKIEWTVHLVNRKAASRKFENFGSPSATDPGDVFPATGAANWRNSGVAQRDKLVIDPGAKTLDGPNQAAGFNSGTVMGINVPLGEMRTQADGALVVLGGWGNSGSFSGVSLQTFADNDGWYDDVSDGPVTAKVTLTGGATPSVEPAWVIVGPPKFAPAIQPIITMYDTLLHAWAKAHPGFDPNYSIDADVKPFYERLIRHVYLNTETKVHSFNATALPAAGSALAKSLFSHLNDPASPVSGNLLKMPRMWSSSNQKNAAVTPLQYAMMKRWAGPNDVSNPALPASSPVLAVYEKLDRAALEVCIGGNLFPGIEASWWMLEKFKYTAPLRLDHASLKPGDVTSQMACPWQSDFSACYYYDDYAWWPAQRPDQVTRGGLDDQDWAKDFGDSREHMVATWHKLGFVVPDGGVQIEKERTAVCKDMFIVTDRNEFGMDEVAAVLDGGSPALFPAAFYVIVEGFTPQELGFTSPNPANLDAIAPAVTFLMPSNMPAGHMQGKPEAPLLQSSDLTQRQRITFQYRVEFDGVQDFLDGASNPIEVQDLTLEAQIQGLMATAPARLLNQPNPYMVDGSTSWLSQDLRVFQVVENTTPFPGIKLDGNDGAAALAFIAKVIDEFNKPVLGTHPFDTISVDQATSKLELSTSVGGKNIFNFAVARVRYKAKTLDAKDVRVFFRLFTTAATGLEYRPTETYRRFTSGSGAIALLGLQAGDIVTLPFFAAARETVKDLRSQTDPKNVMDLKASGTDEFRGYFACWLDFNQDTPLYPFHPLPPDGPFAGGKLSLKELIRGKHQCLVAEVFAPPDAIPDQATPASSDQLAQRNLMIVESDNPGGEDAHTVAHPFLIGPRRAPRQLPATFAALTAGTAGTVAAVALPPAGDGVDELMIRWGNLPRTCDVQVYIPGIAANDLLHQAALRLDDPRMERVDDHTVRLLPADVSFLPIPPEAQARPVPGMLSIVVPDTVRMEQRFHVVVHHVSGADRRIVGAFQLTIPVSVGDRLLRDETRLYAVMRYIFRAVPQESAWYPVFARYVEYLASRVRGFGGDPELVEPSPSGGEGADEWRWRHSLRGRLCAWLHRILRALCRRCKRWCARLCGPRRP